MGVNVRRGRFWVCGCECVVLAVVCVKGQAWKVVFVLRCVFISDDIHMSVNACA